jgi:hypothetical protein
VQLTLNDDSEYDGGRLCFVTGHSAQLTVPVRPAGTLTQHARDILHGVTRLHRGVRYSLFVVDRNNGLGQNDVFELDECGVRSILEQETEKLREENRRLQKKNEQLRGALSQKMSSREVVDMTGEDSGADDDAGASAGAGVGAGAGAGDRGGGGARKDKKTDKRGRSSALRAMAEQQEEHGRALKRVKHEKAAVESKVEKAENDLNCIVCMENPRAIMFEPCNHFVCCEECAARIRSSNNDACPKCRVPLEKAVRIYR